MVDPSSSIGEARIYDDGRIELQLRAEGEGVVGDAHFVYHRGDDGYDEVKAHLEAVHGALQPDKPVWVPPWPDDATD